MVALFPDRKVAKALAVKGGEPVADMHVTLAFLGKARTLDAEVLKKLVAGWAAATQPLSGEVSGKGLFVGGPKPVTYASVDLPDLPVARQRLVDLLDAGGAPVSTEHGFTPHMTLAYDDVDVDVKAQRLEFREVTLAVGNERHTFALGGSAS